MKSLLLVVVMLIFTGCTPMPIKETPPIEKVVELPGHTKDQIYAATKAWVAENFRSAKAVIQDDDKEAGRIIGNGNMRYPCSGFTCLAKNDWTLDFTMRVDIKDQKMKVSFINLGISWPASPGAMRADHIRVSDSNMEDVRPALDKMREELRAAIVKEKTNSSW